MKRFISILIISAIMLNGIMMNVSNSEKFISYKNVTIFDETLAEMVLTGEIPKNVTHLDLSGDGKDWSINGLITDLSPLANLTNLQVLHLGNNQITDLSPLANLTNLQILHLSNNQITDLSPLANLTNLQVLYLSNNQITDITPLANLTNLGGPYGVLGLDNNLINDISPLENLTNLQWLQLDNNLITDLSPLYKLENLTFYTLKGNPVSDDEVALLRLALRKADFVGRVLAGEPTIEDALEILKYLAGMESVVSDGNVAFYTACITGGAEPSIADVLEILKHLAGMSSVFGGGT